MLVEMYSYHRALQSILWTTFIRNQVLEPAAVHHLFLILLDCLNLSMHFIVTYQQKNMDCVGVAAHNDEIDVIKINNLQWCSQCAIALASVKFLYRLS